MRLEDRMWRQCEVADYHSCPTTSGNLPFILLTQTRIFFGTLNSAMCCNASIVVVGGSDLCLCRHQFLALTLGNPLCSRQIHSLKLCIPPLVKYVTFIDCGEPILLCGAYITRYTSKDSTIGRSLANIASVPAFATIFVLILNSSPQLQHTLALAWLYAPHASHSFTGGSPCFSPLRRGIIGSLIGPRRGTLRPKSKTKHSLAELVGLVPRPNFCTCFGMLNV